MKSLSVRVRGLDAPHTLYAPNLPMAFDQAHTILEHGYFYRGDTVFPDDILSVTVEGNYQIHR